jgi:hypothetical protein
MKPLPTQLAIPEARVVFNGDCNFFFYNPELWQPEGGPYRSTAIHACVRRLAASGVDTLAINPNTQVPWYPSSRLPHVLSGYQRGDRAFAQRIARANAALRGAQVTQFTVVIQELLDRYLDLIEAKVDWLKECAAACRAEGLRPWLSYRMNATHFSGAPESPVNCAAFRHSRNRLSGRRTDSGQFDPSWVGLNYARADVRDYMRELILDGAQNYDYDGVELDWLRHPVCVEPPASRGATATITRWLAELRSATTRCGQCLGLRLPANLAYLRLIGLDVKEIVRRRLVDFIVFSNYWQQAWTNPLDQLRRELGGAIRIYGGIEGAPNWLPALAPSLRVPPAYQALQLAGDHAVPASRRPRRQSVRGTRYLAPSPPLLRASAAGPLALGADGVELFNFYVADQVRVPGQAARYEALRELRTLAALRGREKHYCLGTATGASHEQWDDPAPLPCVVGGRESHAFRLPMAAETAVRGAKLVVQLIAHGWPAGASIKVRFNGTRLSPRSRRTHHLLSASGPYRQHVPENVAHNFSGTAALVREGWNEIHVVNTGRSSLPLAGVEVAVRPPPGARPRVRSPLHP